MQQSDAVERPAHIPESRVIDYDIYQPVREGLDFHESWKALQDTGLPEIVWTPRNGGHWMVLRGRLVNEVLSDYKRFSNHTVLVPKETAGEAYRLIPLSLDPPEHRPFRNLLQDHLSPRGVRPIEGYIRELTVSLIEEFREKGRCNFTHEFAELLPIRVFMKIVDLPLDDLPKLKPLADQFTRPDGTMEYPDVVKGFKDYLGPVIEGRRGGDGTDMLSRMINGEIEGRDLTDEEATNICMQVLVGGLDTVVNLMGFVMLFVAENPESRRILAADHSLIPDAIRELVRRFPLVTVGREVTHDLDYEGVQLKKGEMIVAPTVLHGLDETENPDAMSVKFDREKISHSTFGNGSHTCPGAHLGRTEIRIMLEEWLSRIPEFRLESDSDITYTGGIVGSVDPFCLTWDVATTRSS